jgi:uncharacterized delta-60 repeat protein
LCCERLPLLSGASPAFSFNGGASKKVIVMASSNFSSGAGAGEKLSPGDRVGGGLFLLKRLLGRGEISEVWLAQDIKNSRQVALKFLPVALLSDANVVERLKQDAQRYRLLVHPNIAATYEFMRDHSSAAVVVEYVEGWSLATLKVDKLCRCYHVGEIERWIHQLCAALDFAHDEFGIVHSDLKPANLLINGQEELKVTDFALAQTVRAESSRRGLVKGLYSGLGFLSPQQVMGAEPSKADDIYSLGATIFDLLTGTPPFYKGEVFAQICSLKPPSMTERVKELEIQDDPVSPVWEDVVARCLAKNPADRPQSAKEVLQLLERKELPKPVEPQIKADAVAEIAAKSSGAAEAVAVNEIEAKTENAAEAKSAPEFAPVPPNKSMVLVVAAALAIIVLAAGLFTSLVRMHGASGKKTSPVVIQAGPPGSRDNSFDPGTGANGEVRCVAVQPDGNVLIGGKFTTFNGKPIQRIVRLNADGSVDGYFAPNLSGTVHAIALQADGKILVGGDGMQPGHGARRVMRLNADGSVDNNFKLAVNYNGEVRAIQIQPDGKILVSGSFTRVRNQNQNRIVRLNADGTLDGSFKIGGGATGIVSGLALQPDGKILAVGKITSFDNRPFGGLVRLMPDGSVDESFKCGAGDRAEVYAVNVLADGKILIGGNFTSFNGVAVNRIARLNPDGTVDTSFNPGAGPDDDIIGFAVQPDGKIVIGGDFTHVQGSLRNRIARLEADGSLDKSFVPETGADNAVWRIALQADGKVMIVGAFKNFDNISCGGVARLQN